jgi:hypothetical protein
MNTILTATGHDTAAVISVKAAPPPTQSQELPVAEIRAFMDETRTFMNEMRAWVRNIDSRVTSLERASMN